MASPELARLGRVLRLRQRKRDAAAQRLAAAQDQWRQLAAQLDELAALADEYNALFHEKATAAGHGTATLEGMQRFYAQVAGLREQQRSVANRAAVARDEAHRALTAAQSELAALEALIDKRALAHKKSAEKKVERARISPRPQSLV